MSREGRVREVIVQRCANTHSNSRRAPPRSPVLDTVSRSPALTGPGAGAGEGREGGSGGGGGGALVPAEAPRALEAAPDVAAPDAAVEAAVPARRCTTAGSESPTGFPRALRNARTVGESRGEDSTTEDQGARGQGDGRTEEGEGGAQ